MEALRLNSSERNRAATVRERRRGRLKEALPHGRGSVVSDVSRLERRVKERKGTEAAAHKHLSVGRKHQAADGAAEAPDVQELLLGGDVPEFQSAVLAG